MKRVLGFLLFLVFSANSFALTAPFLVESDGVTQTSLEKLLSRVEVGSIFLLGELHHNVDHHNNQLAVVRTLIELGHQVNLGMEFLNYTDQFHIYKYSTGLISKDNFLKAVQWRTPETFEFYSPLFDAVNSNQGSIIGLNVPRTITSKVAEFGVDSLTRDDYTLLPYPLEYGNSGYFERFYETVGGGHVPEDKIVNYFWSQSIWDDVMSWKAIEFMDKNPDSLLVITVGDFHTAYGGGLAELLKRKGFGKVVTLSQTVLGDLSDEDILKEITPHPKHGKRADWIWVTD